MARRPKRGETVALAVLASVALLLAVSNAVALAQGDGDVASAALAVAALAMLAGSLAYDRYHRGRSDA